MDKIKIIETAKNFTFVKDFREQEPDAYNGNQGFIIN